MTLRSKAAKPEADPIIRKQIQVLEKERDELRTSLKKAEEQLDAFLREVVVQTLKATFVDLDRYILKSDHANILKKREEAELKALAKIPRIKEKPVRGGK